MKTLLFGYLQKLMGGGASYVLLGLGAAMVFQYWQIGQMRGELEALAREKEAAIAQAREKQTIITSQSRQFRRELATQKEETHAEDIIKSVPDSDHCLRSAPVRSALEWLRQHEGADAQANHD